MSDHGPPKDDDLEMKSPPPAYSEVSAFPMSSQGGPACMAYPAHPPTQQGYPPEPPYGQPYMQGYPADASKNLERGPGAPYPPPAQHYLPPGSYPAQGLYPQSGQYPPGPPVYSPGQPFPAGSYPPGPYTQVPYGHPTGTVVVTQPSGTTVVVAQSRPPDNMILSWMACLFCFCPIGFFAVIYSWQAKNANETNDFQAAAKYGTKAKRLAITSIIFGILVFIICIVLRLIIYTSYPTASY